MDGERTTCAVVGGGPAGMVLGLLLARAGVDVTVLEKHADFLRDFRGDTVHPSTLTLIDELGLWDRFATLPWKPIDKARVVLDSGPVQIADTSRLRVPHPFIAMVPQWHLLDMLAEAAAEEPTFTLLREAEVVDLLHSPEGRVTGVRWHSRAEGAEGAVHDLHADLVVAADGRDSRVRELSGLPLHAYEVPMDVWWFRIPRGDADDPAGGLGRVTGGRLLVMLDRGDYYQCAYLIPRGADAEYRTRPITVLQDDLRALHPWLGDRAAGVTSWDDVKLLEVTLDRLHRWHAPGLLCIGDSAHAMSPIGGIGINLAVQDAVATARALGPVLGSARARGADPVAVDRAAARVQWRRYAPTALTQAAQQLAHRTVIGPTLLAAAGHALTSSERAPLVLRVLQRFPALQAIPARAIGMGLLPEHAPAWARRRGSGVAPRTSSVREATPSATR